MRMMPSESWKRSKPCRERTIKTLIIGNGEVGQALREVIAPHHETHVKDIEPLFVTGIEVLQICYPDHADFIKNTKDYIKLYNPKLTIINSSVPVGTCANFDGKVIYSPVRGRHPKLASDLKIYTKFVFGNNSFARGLAMDYFRMCGLNCVEFRNTAIGEVLKLLSNIHMGIEIGWRQEVDRILQYFENVSHGTSHKQNIDCLNEIETESLQQMQNMGHDERSSLLQSLSQSEHEDLEKITSINGTSAPKDELQGIYAHARETEKDHKDALREMRESDCSSASPRLQEPKRSELALQKVSPSASSIYQTWEDTYADGYSKSGDNHLIRPRMRPDPIGGHCILPCTKILAKQFPSKIFDFVLESNEKRLREASVGA